MAVFDPDLQPSSDRGHLLTEQSNQRSSQLDQLDTLAVSYTHLTLPTKA